MMPQLVKRIVDVKQKGRMIDGGWIAPSSTLRILKSLSRLRAL